MRKSIIPTLAFFLMLQGCNDSKESSSCTPSNENGSKAIITNELKSFAQNMVGETDSLLNKGFSISTQDNSEENNEKSYQKTTVNSCESGGTKSFIDNNNLEGLSQAEIQESIKKGIGFDMVLDDCIENNVKSDGTISIEMKNEEHFTILVTFKERTKIEDLESSEKLTFLKDSTFKSIEISDEQEKLVENMTLKSTLNGTYTSIELISYENELEDGGYSTYKVSGQINHNATKYKVDEKYDGSKTPMVENENGDLLSGTEKYYNEKNEHVTLTVLSKNKFKISLDKDNDGVDDAEEILSF